MEAKWKDCRVKENEKRMREWGRRMEARSAGGWDRKQGPSSLRIYSAGREYIVWVETLP